MDKCACFGASGLTLLEAMVALMILTTGLLAAAAMLDVSVQGHLLTQRSVEDTIAASTMVERILALPYDDPRLDDPDGEFNPRAPDHGPVTVGQESTTMEWEVDEDFPIPNTKRVMVTLRTSRGPSAPRETRFDYLKSRDLNGRPDAEGR